MCLRYRVRKKYCLNVDSRICVSLWVSVNEFTVQVVDIEEIVSIGTAWLGSCSIYCVLCVGLPLCEHSAAPLAFTCTVTLAPSVHEYEYSNVFVLLRQKLGAAARSERLAITFVATKAFSRPESFKDGLIKKVKCWCWTEWLVDVAALRDGNMWLWRESELSFLRNCEIKL